MALGVGVVYACIYKIASTLASLPLNLYADNGRTFDIIDNPANYLLNKTPDERVTAFEFRETLVFSMLLFGSGYAEIIRDRNGSAVQFQMLHYHAVKLVEVDGQPIYEIKTKDGVRYVDYDNMIALHYSLRQSPALTSAETVGLLSAAQDYAAKFFNGGGVMSGVLTSDENLNPDQVQSLLNTWQQQQGKQTRFMPFGVKYHRMGVDPDSAQNVDSRNFQGQEVCRVFNVPPAMVGFTGGAYKDYENQAKAFVTGTIVPLAQRTESELNLKLLSRRDRDGQTFRHDIDELMRGDMASRAEYYREMLQNGVMSRNEVRSKERYNAIDGGDIHTVQVNQIALDKFDEYSEKISTQDGNTEV